MTIFLKKGFLLKKAVHNFNSNDDLLNKNYQQAYLYFLDI
jgi:hypothetical protein